MFEHNLLNLDQMAVKATAIKQNAGFNPPAFNDLFLTNSHRYNTRNKSQVIPRCHTIKLNQQPISFRGPSNIWNALPVNIKDKNKALRRLPKNVTNYLARTLHSNSIQ